MVNDDLNNNFCQNHPLIMRFEVKKMTAKNFSKDMTEIDNVNSRCKMVAIDSEVLYYHTSAIFWFQSISKWKVKLS